MCKTTVECPKCIGNRKIERFSHIASGDCFMCGGSGTIQIDSSFKDLQASDKVKKQLEWIVKATPAQWNKLTWEQINKARSLGHSELAIKAKVVWPQIAEEAFQAMQDEKRLAWC